MRVTVDYPRDLKARLGSGAISSDHLGGITDEKITIRLEDISTRLMFYVAPFCLSTEMIPSLPEGIGVYTPTDDPSPLMEAYLSWIAYLGEKTKELMSDHSFTIDQINRLYPVGYLGDCECVLTLQQFGNLVASSWGVGEKKELGDKLKETWCPSISETFPLKPCMNARSSVRLPSPLEREYKQPFKLKRLEGIPRKLKKQVEGHPVMASLSRGVVTGVLTYGGLVALSMMRLGEVACSNSIWVEDWLPKLDAEEYHEARLAFIRAMKESEDPIANELLEYGSHLGGLRSFIWVLDTKEKDQFLNERMCEDLGLLRDFLKLNW